MPQVDINWMGVLAGIVVSMLVGYVWYSMPVFGRTWMNLIGKTEADLKAGAGPAMGGAVVVSFILSYVMAHVLQYVNANTWQDGAVTGVWMWLGFVFTTVAVHNFFSRKPFTLTIIDSGYHLVQLALMGAVMGAL